MSDAEGLAFSGLPPAGMAFARDFVREFRTSPDPSGQPRQRKSMPSILDRAFNPYRVLRKGEV